MTEACASLTLDNALGSKHFDHLRCCSCLRNTGVMTAAPISVCLAGATGWAGSELARAIASLSDVVLVAAVSRTHAGRRLGEVLGDARITCPIYPSAAEALASRCDVFVEYTKPESAKANVLAAVEHGAHVVVGTSGLTEQDYTEIDIRLPGFVISAEVSFGMPDQRLSIRHDSGSSARPYVHGVLLAIRRVSTLVGVHRGLDTVLDL